MKIAIGIISLGILLGSCSGTEKEDGLAGELNEALESVAVDANEFNGKLDELLTLEMASNCSGLPSKEAEVDYRKTMKNPEYHSLEYKWKSDRKREIDYNGMKIEAKAPNVVKLSWVKESDLKKFTFNYHNPTEKELADAKKAMKAKKQEMIDEGKITAEQAEIVDGFTDHMVTNFNVIDVPNLGEKAVWIQDKHENHLKVLYKGIDFQLLVELSDNESENKAKAIELAKEVMKNI